MESKCSWCCYINWRSDDVTRLRSLYMESKSSCCYINCRNDDVAIFESFIQYFRHDFFIQTEKRKALMGCVSDLHGDKKGIKNLWRRRENISLIPPKEGQTTTRVSFPWTELPSFRRVWTKPIKLSKNCQFSAYLFLSSFLIT